MGVGRIDYALLGLFLGANITERLTGTMVALYEYFFIHTKENQSVEEIDAAYLAFLLVQ